MLVSGVQQRESVIDIHVSNIFGKFKKMIMLGEIGGFLLFLFLFFFFFTFEEEYSFIFSSCANALLFS